MRIRKAYTAEYERLLDIWEESVRATHNFLREEHIQYYRSRIVGAYFPGVELYVGEGDDGVAEAFMGVVPPMEQYVGKDFVSRPAHLSMLFVHPANHGKGIGRTLVQYAVDLYGDLAADVNEQNPGAFQFYQKCGFVQTGRSETDEEGNPFPILHLFRTAQGTHVDSDSLG